MDWKNVVYEGKDPYIFISYAHMDDAIVLPIIEKLHQQGHRVWYDAGIVVGTDWAEYIAEHLQNSSCVIAFFSKNYLNSRYCQKELKYTLKNDLEPLVVYLEDVDLTPGLQMQLDDIQALFRSHYSDDDLLTRALCESKILQPCRICESAASQSQTDPISTKDIAEKYLAAADSFFYEDKLEHAFDAYKCAAELGLAEAQLALGESYLRGEGVAIDAYTARKWFSRAAEQGLPQAQLALGDCYYHGHGCLKDYEQAAIAYRAAADKGLADAQLALAECYFKGHGVKKSPVSSIFWYQQAADQNQPDAQLALARCYEEGKGVPKNKATALDWYRRAAQHGSKEAQAVMERYKSSCSTAASVESNDNLLMDDADIQYKMGNSYYNGDDAPPDYEKAAIWYRKAAEQEHADAQLSLGVCYERGRGVPESRELAAHWYLRSAEQGNVKAQYKMGVCFNCGEGVEKSIEESAKWFEKAAQQGHMQAQCKMGFLYEKGIGVPQSLDDAVFWFQKAAENGSSRAEDALQKILKRKKKEERLIASAVKNDE